MVKGGGGATSKLKQIRSACDLYFSKNNNNNNNKTHNICQYNNIVQMAMYDNKFNPTSLEIYSSITEN